MTARCMVCSRSFCRDGYLYVVVDERDDSFKIGCTYQLPSQRLKNYRANDCHFFHLAYTRQAGCRWTAQHREQEALRRLGSVAENIRGDWFRGDVRDAIAAVDLVCEGVGA